MASLAPLSRLPRDGLILFSARSLRMFSYGMLAVVLTLFLKNDRHFTDQDVGNLFTATLIGDAAISLVLTSIADNFGRRSTLLVGAALMAFAGIVFAYSTSYLWLLLASIFGVISPGGGDLGPFLAVEQAAITKLLVVPEDRTGVFAWYNLFGTLCVGFGSLFGGFIADVYGYDTVVILYGVVGLLLAALFWLLSSEIELDPSVMAQIAQQPVNVVQKVLSKVLPSLPHSQSIVLKLSVLFSIDAFAGAIVLQSFIAFWFNSVWSFDPRSLGGILFVVNIISAFSSLVSASIAARFGLINTMVFTHLPSNVLLMMIPLMPSYHSAIMCLFARYSISQMDVPARQSYVAGVVHPSELSAAGGVTGVARSVGGALGPLLAGYFAQNGEMSMPFYVAGGIKVAYDLVLLYMFKSVKPVDEQPQLVSVGKV